MSADIIKKIELKSLTDADYKRQFVGCLVITKDNKIHLQQRGEDWKSFPGYLCEFGGRIEAGELPMQALIRELNEELGAIVKEIDVISLGAVTEQSSNYADLIHVYCWRDKQGTITGCYEGEARSFDTVEEILKHPRKSDALCWMLDECKKRGVF